jgi:predicted nucleotidyltransferase
VVRVYLLTNLVRDMRPSDTDYYGIFIPPKEKTLGIDSFESFVFPGDVSHRKRGERDPNELDISLHSLQKWAGMAAKGNPTVISFLFSKLEYLLLISDTPADDKIRFAPWDWVLEQRDLFLAKSHYLPFIHYAHDQMQRLLGLRGQKNINRDHLVDLYGYDTKYAMHIIRLLIEAKELMQTGRISYPNLQVELLKDIRRGKFKLTEIHQMGEQLNAEVLAAVSTSPLPEKVDRAAISKLIADVHLEYYSV